jgi:hypothetical protein
MRICLACGRPKADCLVQLGSLRCHDCRADNKPLSFGVAARARPAAGFALPRRARVSILRPA